MIWSLYNLVIRLLSAAMHVQSLFNSKARKGIIGRRGTYHFPTKKNKRVLIHCASLGEYEQAKPIINKCKQEGLEVILSFFSPSGHEPQKSDPSVDAVIYLPFDIPSKVKRFLKVADLDLMIFVKYEFWWNFIRADAPIIFVSVSVRPEHYLFKSWASPFLSVLSSVDQLFVSDQASFDLLNSRGFQNIQLSGDTRVESVLDRKKLGIEDRVISSFCGDANVVIFASTYPIEHNEIVEMSNESIGDEKMLIFPHEIDHREIRLLKESLGKDAVIYSDWKHNPVFSGHRIMIVDQIGLLKDAYAHGSLAYIGGGFGHGIHNVLEPFVYKLPLIYGPIHTKFSEAKLLAQKSFVRAISDLSELSGAITSLQEGDVLMDIEDTYMEIFHTGLGSSDLVMNYIKKEIWKKSE